MTEIVWKSGNKSEMSSKEVEISEAYDLEWYEEGLRWNGRPHNIDEVVRRVQNDVFLICPLESWKHGTLQFRLLG
jgi:hypothetical protein